MATAVVFDCESDKLFDKGKKPERSARKTEEEARREEISRMECTVACALVLDAAQIKAIAALRARSAAKERAVHMLQHDARRVVCWRDRCSLTPDGKVVPPFEPLLCEFDAASVIVGYNQLNFDMQLLRKYYGSNLQRYMAHRAKCLDPFVVVRALTDEWLGLNALLAANELQPKVGEGTSAVELWDAVQMGTPDQARVAREALETYCAADVERTAHLVLLSTMRVPSKIPFRLPNSCCGLASRLAAVELSKTLEAS